MRTLPVHALPQLDPVFRRWLRDPSRDLDDQMAWIEHVGSTNLLADVVKFYQPREGKWAGNIQNCMLRYWIRCDPKEGVKALERALRARQNTGLQLDTTMLKKYGLNPASVQQSFVLLRQWCVSARAAAATVGGRQSEPTYATNPILDDGPQSLAAPTGHLASFSIGLPPTSRSRLDFRRDVGRHARRRICRPQPATGL